MYNKFRIGKYIYENISSLSDIRNLQEKVNSLGINGTEIQLIDADVNISYGTIFLFLEPLEEFNASLEDFSCLVRGWN